MGDEEAVPGTAVLLPGRFAAVVAGGFRFRSNCRSRRKQ
jgi:hypothetical protein